MQDPKSKVIFPPNDAPPGPSHAGQTSQAPVSSPPEQAVAYPEPVVPSASQEIHEPSMPTPSPDSTQAGSSTEPLLEKPVIQQSPQVTQKQIQNENMMPLETADTSAPQSAVEPLQESVQNVPFSPPANRQIVQPITVPNTVVELQTPVAAPQVVQPSAIPEARSTLAFKKKNSVPKFLLFGFAVLLLLGVIGFAVFRLLGSGTGSSVGTKGQITWWGYKLDKEIVDPLIAEYQTQNPDIKITYVKQSPQDYRERLTNSLAKGEGPDIFEIHNSWPAMFKNDLSVLPASVMTPDEYKGTYYPVIVSDMTSQKGIVGMPLYYDAITLYVNEDIFSAALKAPPKVWNDVVALANPISGITQKDASGRIIQSAIALGTTENVEYWPEIFGLLMYQDKSNLIALDSEKVKKEAIFYQSFTKTIGTWDTTMPNSVEAFAKQKTAMVFAPSDAAFTIVQQAPSLRFKTYKVPQLEKETPSDPDFTYATYWSEGVWERSASKEEAWKFLKYMSSAETLQKINQNLKNANKGERAYPIPSLNQQFLNHPILGSIVSLAQSAKSWYLADKTNDGATGLNTQLKNAYAQVFTGDPKTAQSEVTKILNQYGIPLPK